MKCSCGLHDKYKTEQKRPTNYFFKEILVIIKKTAISISELENYLFVFSPCTNHNLRNTVKPLANSALGSLSRRHPASDARSHLSRHSHRAVDVVALRAPISTTHC